MRSLFPVAGIGFVWCSMVAAQPVAVRVTLDASAAPVPVADEFMGLGYETSAVVQAGYFSNDNATLVQLYKNLSPHGLIRIGGIISDHTRYEANGQPVVADEHGVTVINRDDLQNLGEFAHATGWRIMWGLNLGTGTKEQAVEQAQAADAALSDRLQSFEIGNEVDFLKRFNKNFDAYHAAYTEYKSAIRIVLPKAAFSGPDAAWSMDYVQKFVAAEANDIATVTRHYYRGGARQPDATMAKLLAHDDAFDQQLDQLRAMCEPHHLQFRINETNSFSGGGKPGVSDTLGGALWALDYLLTLAAHGSDGVNIETDINQLGFISRYSPIVHDQTTGACTARPEYYGLLAFASATDGSCEIVPLKYDRGGANVMIYGVRNRADKEDLRLAIINKDATKDVTIELPANEAKSATALRLTGPSLDATAGITFAGTAVNDPTGQWLAGAGEVIKPHETVFQLSVPHASAVVLKLR